MDTVRISNSECLPRYHGLDGFPHVDNVDYLRSMMREEPFTRAGGVARRGRRRRGGGALATRRRRGGDAAVTRR